MVKRIRNIRIEDEVWYKARLDALRNGMTLQDWVSTLILGGDRWVLDGGVNKPEVKVGTENG